MDSYYITTPEAAKLFGLNHSYAAKLARESHKAGNPYPIKRGLPWEATVEQWEKIFNPPKKQRRKSRRKVKSSELKGSRPIEGISCAKAAKRLGMSYSWAYRLSQRAVQRRYPWPKRAGKQWIAPLEEWEKIFRDPFLREWERKR
ncbi:hypothetical protein [Desmospora activa]|uniref:Uncharacterized protein n=1 Tax=Desmospora activa DSM 45169 TaxID=1121389 RepID=A0A2T4YYY0_9BACL|nr:hypothetical protein [Desmospora activa]PTM52188.1 hypothetical protein C8J48_3735 [Desmospora activa DSM 45169]